MSPNPNASPSHAGQASSSRTVVGACNLCEAICGLVFEVEDTAAGERITAVRGNPDDPFSRGHICPKAVALKDLHEDPDRLKQPIRRVTGPDGQTTWQPIGWDQAFDLVVEGLVRVREQHGANAVAVYQGNPTVHNWGNITHGPQFFGQLKTRHRYSATSVDQLPHHIAAWWLYGHQMLIPIPDIDRTGYMLMLGANPLASNGSLMTVPDVRKRLKALRERGGRLVVIDPRHTETAAVADEHHFITPGSDALWLLAIVNTLLAESLMRAGPLTPLLDGLEGLKAAVAPFTPEQVADATGIDAATTRRLARELAAADGGVCYGRMGVSTQAHGVVCQWAIQVINLLTGNVDREGGALVTTPAVDLIALGLMGPGHQGAWRSRVRGAPEFGGELPVSTLAEEILTPGAGQVRAVVTSCGNPVLSTPNGRQLDRALQGLDFMVSIDFYLNETTRHAHVILPPTCAVEHDHYDLIFWHLAVRNATRYAPAIVAPAAGSLHDWQIFGELARRYASRAWALDRGGPWQRLKALAAREIGSRLPPERMLALALKRSAHPGLTLKRLKRNPQGLDLGPLKPSLAQRLSRRSRRIGLLPAPIAQELPVLARRLGAADASSLATAALPASTTLQQATPDSALPSMRLAQVQEGQPSSAADSPHGLPSLHLIGRRDVRSNNSWMHNSTRLTSGKARCVLWIHPEDAAARGLRDGEMASVHSRVGRVTVPLHVTDAIKPGVVSLPHGWGHDRPGASLSVAARQPGASLNDLTDDQLTDTLSGNAAFSAVPVTVAAALASTTQHPTPEPAARSELTPA